MWAVANVLIGVCAILPLGLGLTLVSRLAQGPSTTVFGRPAMFEIDGGSAGSATGIVLVTLAVLGGLFVLVNVPFRRRFPVGLANVVWPAATLLALVPFAVALAFQWS